jgi:isocitrate dehydrogenase
MAIANHLEREMSDSTNTQTTIAVAYGDGIGPEIMDATVRILDAAGARLNYENVEIGEAVYTRGHSAGIEPETWETLRRTKVFLKAPITTPQGGGFKSLNVTVRKTLGLYSNVRPCVSYHPIVPSLHPDMNLVVIRENEEDLYAGIEHRQTDEVYQCLKLITRPGCERISRYAFEYARAHGRKKITCMTKDNIMKMTDGLFHKVFDEIGAEYPEIEKEHWIIDIGMARAANRPGNFDVILVPNLYGDILSDVTAEVAGSVGLAPSANIGDGCAMFEAIHGSAPRLAGQNAANPSGLLLAAVMMMVHVGQPEVAERIHNAWLKTLEDGIHTKDIFREGTSIEKVGTAQFADAVISRLGQLPSQMAPVKYVGQPQMKAMASYKRAEPAKKELVGVDVFVHWGGNADDLAEKLNAAQSDVKLGMITNRGVKVWPQGMPETFLTDHYRCRYMHEGLTLAQIVRLQSALETAGVNFIKTEHLYNFDGEAGFSLGQGQ